LFTWFHSTVAFLDFLLIWRHFTVDAVFRYISVACITSAPDDSVVAAVGHYAAAVDALSGFPGVFLDNALSFSLV
jgi:hypothetical protein